jgi:type I restriction enzyme S subunit
MLDRRKNTGVPRRYLRNPNIRWFDFDLSDLQEILVEEKDVHKYEVRDGDVLICEGGEAGRAALWTGDSDGIIFQKACHRVRVGERLDAKYLIHRLFYDYHTGGLADYYTGATIKHFTGQDLARYEFPLPPLDEQRRIAAILDKADALRRKRKQAIEMLDNLAQSTFLELFGNPKNNPKGWRRGRIGDLLEDTQYGTSAKAGENGQFPILRMGNLTSDGRIDLSSLKYIDLADRDVDKYTVRRGDILFNRTNSADLVGKTAVYSSDECIAFAGYLVRARVKNGVSPHFISSYLNSRHGKATLRGMAKSIVGMANINAKEMQSIPILIPDAQTQCVYSSALTSISAARDTSERHLQLLTSAFSSLQHRAFSGQL